MNSDDPNLTSHLMRAWPIVWPFLGGLGGAIVSLGLAKNENLDARKKLFKMLAGTIAAVFLGPLMVRLIAWWYGAGLRADSEIVGAIYCVVGLFATSLIDRVLRRLENVVDKVPLPGVKEPE
jgi:hypothetical protein